MSNSFTKKLLKINISLTQGTFDGSHNTVTLEGLRMEVHVKKGGEPAKNSAKIKIYGMRQTDMNKLTTIPAKDKKAMVVHNSIVQVLAGDVNGMSIAFQGNITGAYASYQSPPNLVFQMDAMEGYYPSIAPAKPKSFKGPTSVKILCENAAASMGYNFEDNGVNAQLDSPYLEGSEYSQAASAAEAADLEFGVDDGTLFIAPKGGARSGYVPLISAASGLKEYPIFDKEGVKFTCLYNSALKLGGLVKVESVVDVASGVWRIHGLEHNLEAEKSNGHWFSTVHGTRITT